MAAVPIRVCSKENIDDKEEREGEREKEKERANRWWIWQGLHHAGAAETRLEGTQSAEASLTRHSQDPAAGTEAVASAPRRPPEPGCSSTPPGHRGDY